LPAEHGGVRGLLVSRTAVAEHAFLSDCASSALVTRGGSVDWLCLPRFDSPPVLGRLLDDDAGHLVLRPADPAAVAERRYLPHSLVLETAWTSPSGQLVVHDALALGEHERGHALGRTSPGVLLRRAWCTAGTVEVVLEFSPRPEFGLVHPRLVPVPGGMRTLGGATVLMLSTAVPLDIAGATASGTIVLNEGGEMTVALEQASAWDPAPRPWSARKVRRRLVETEKVWRSWSSLHQRYDGPLRELVHHSGLVLQGLTYARSGAIVAAATTSLPEGDGSARTWDYRYTWVRDASMTMRGLYVAACPDEASRFFAFLARAAATQLDRGMPLQIMFGVGGERDLSERELHHLSGWRDSAPVRTGNGAWTQHQQDVYGALLDAAFVLRTQLDPMDQATQAFLVAAVEAAAGGWRTPDQGIWEIRGPARRYLHSALMCWVALDRGIALAGALGADDRVPRWAQVRADIRAAILEHGWDSEVGAFTQSFGSPELDSSALLVALVGILPPGDPRLASTIDAVTAALSDERGLLYRYRNEDNLAGEEGTFLLCTFWLAEALAVTGRPAEAEQVLRRAAACANDLGLLAEQTSATTGELLGNYPQAFSHLGLVLAAQAVAAASPEAPPPETASPSLATNQVTSNPTKEEVMLIATRAKTTTTHDPRGGGHPRLIFGHDHHAPTGSPQREFDLQPGVTVIGSSPGADLQLAGLDSRHGEIRRDTADEYVYVHLGTLTSGTVNGLPVTRKVLHTGDRIQLGSWTLSFYREEFADHGRPHGGRLGGQRHQPPQQQPRPRGTTAAGGHPEGVNPGEYF